MTDSRAAAKLVALTLSSIFVIVVGVIALAGNDRDSEPMAPGETYDGGFPVPDEMKADVIRKGDAFCRNEGYRPRTKGYADCRRDQANMLMVVRCLRQGFRHPSDGFDQCLHWRFRVPQQIW